jgi:D-glycero-alpha-D-manno-heptose-7-phosphate kinase
VVCAPSTRRCLQESLLLLYTGITRSANGILLEESRNLAAQPEARRAMDAQVRLAQELRAALCADDLTAFGEILHQGWLQKRQMANGISTAQIDAWYDRARAHGATGGKITGAGGGGFLLLYGPPDRHAAIVGSLPELRPVPFQLEPQGSKIIYLEG